MTTNNCFPEMIESRIFWPTSEPVLVRVSGGTFYIATLEQVYEDEPPKWYTSGPERWELTDVVKWWHLPDDVPTNATNKTE